MKWLQITPLGIQGLRYRNNYCPSPAQTTRSTSYRDSPCNRQVRWYLESGPLHPTALCRIVSRLPWHNNVHTVLTTQEWLGGPRILSIGTVGILLRLLSTPRSLRCKMLRVLSEKSGLRRAGGLCAPMQYARTYSVSCSHVKGSKYTTTIHIPMQQPRFHDDVLLWYTVCFTKTVLALWFLYCIFYYYPRPIKEPRYITGIAVKLNRR